MVMSVRTRKDILDEISALVDELLQLEISEAERRAPKSPTHPRKAHFPVQTEPFVPSDKVEVTVRDVYFRRRGMIVGRRGSHYWDLILEKQEGEDRAPRIWKKATSLRLVDSSRTDPD